MTLRRGTCTLPDSGWNCAGDAGHDGPCAAWPDDPRDDPSFEEVESVYEFGLVTLTVVVVALVLVGVLIGLAIK